MEENTAFIRSMLDKGKMEDLSIVTKEADRTKFLSDTQTIINDRLDLVKLTTEVCSDAEIMDLKT